MSKNIKKRHHFIPECYSENFTYDSDQKYIFVYDKDKDCPPASRSIKDTGVIGHYNSFEKHNGERDTNTVEDMYSVVESIWPDLISKFNERKMITPNDLSNLCTFVASMHVRVPNFRLRYGSISGEGFKTTGILLGDLAQAGEKVANLPVDGSGTLTPDQLIKLRDGLTNNQLIVTVGDQIDLRALQVIEDLYKHLIQLNWSVMTSESTQDFVISDNPMIWYDLRDLNNVIPYKGGLSNPYVEVIFPLTKRLILIGNHGFSHKFAYGLIGAENEVQRLNQTVVISAEQYVYASQSNLNALVRKYKDVAPRTAFKRLPLGNGKQGYQIVNWPTLGSREESSVSV